MAGYHCDWQTENPQKGSTLTSRVIRFQDFCWEGVPVQRYKTAGGDWQDVVRHEIAGRRGEQTAFHLRYFEVSPGGRSSFERHRHEHVVVVVRGRGRVRLGDDYHDIGPLDAVYVAPQTPHQFLNPNEEPFGFLCIVDADRDAPQPVTEPDRS
jgi:ribulose-bisphosphate carboxylase large chain